MARLKIPTGYLATKEAAKRAGVTVDTIQKYCSKIPVLDYIAVTPKMFWVSIKSIDEFKKSRVSTRKFEFKKHAEIRGNMRWIK